MGRNDGVHDFRIAVAGEIRAPTLIERHGLKHLVLALVGEVDVRRQHELVVAQPWRMTPDIHQPVARRVRQRLQQNAVDDAEDQRVGANSHRQRQ